MPPSLDEIRAAPKVLLHDHLDGGPRAATVVDLARQIGYDRLPSDDPDTVKVWLQRGANRGHLNLYLDAFQHTVAVMQTREALIRVAAECAEDLAADGVVYAEVRFAPELHVAGGLSLDEVVEAVLEGFRAGGARRGITVYALLTAMRTAARSLEIAELAVRYRDAGVVGFDIAGAGGRQPAEPPPRCVPVRGAGELPHHDPRRGGLRAAVDLGGAAVVRRGAARPWGADHGRHRDQPGGDGDAGPAGQLCPGPADPAGDVPDLERADRGGAVDRGPPDPAAAPALVPGDGEHRQPAHERGDPVLGVPPPGADVRLRLVRTSSGSRSTR